MEPDKLRCAIYSDGYGGSISWEEMKKPFVNHRDDLKRKRTRIPEADLVDVSTSAFGGVHLLDTRSGTLRERVNRARCVKVVDPGKVSSHFMFKTT